jgi:hypothetical protein
LAAPDLRAIAACLNGWAGQAPSIRPHRPENVTRTAAARDLGVVFGDVVDSAAGYEAADPGVRPSVIVVA